jgi:ubiquinone/menaquinone biosynthesis C-methylase UbiE
MRSAPRALNGTWNLGRDARQVPGMSSREARRATFDTVAEQYDRYRPTYPEQLVDDVIELSGIPRQGRVLEIGSGTGKGTLPFARRGLAITCIERGANLARVAARNLAAHPNVQILVSQFEDWQGEEGELDLVFAAQSFHFLDSRTALPRIARLLRVGGALAIFGSRAERGSSPVDQQIQAAYALHAPAMVDGDLDAPLEDRIDASECFGTVVMTRYRWRTTYTSEEFVGLTETFSPQRLLPDEQRANLTHAIREAIDSSGGTIAVEYVTRLHLAKRRFAPGSGRG